MKFNRITAAALAAATVACAGAAYANGMPKQHATVVSRDSHGRATRVEVAGKDYAVCSKGTKDNCIDPRAAGLNFGNVPLNYWPGKPASQMHHR